jgi:tRNA(His) guanylyltransferase
MKDSIGDRMKANYENRYRIKLTRRIPVILRLDGKCFHTLTRYCDKPFDVALQHSMVVTASRVCNEIMGAKFAYVQSDEISILITDFDKLTTEAWFDYNVQKMVSVAASIAGVKFTTAFFPEDGMKYEAFFDARAFNVPREEVANYFVWRQKDWIRNSVSMLAQANFSHKQLQGKNQAAMHEMLHEIGINWADLELKWKNGTFLIRDENGTWKTMDDYVVIKDRQVIESLLDSKEE